MIEIGAGTIKDKIVVKARLAPWAGFEPATKRLTVACSTTELPGNTVAVEGLCFA